MDKKLILSKGDTNGVYKALINEGIAKHEDSTTEWATTYFRR